MLSLDQIATIARDTAARHAFNYPSNSGRTEFTYSVAVTLTAEGSLFLTAEANVGPVSEKRASEELAKVWRETMARLDSATLEAHKALSSRGYKMWRVGFWNMGVFCTSAWRKGLAARPAASAA